MRAIQIARSAVLALAILALAQSLSFSVVAQNVYKVVDEAGNIAYTDRLPMNQLDGSVERVSGLHIDRTNESEMLIANQTSGKRRAAEQQAQQIRNDHDTELAALAAAKAEKRAANCEQANRRLATYTEARRLYRTTEDGEREYFSSDELDSARADAILSVDEWCG